MSAYERATREGRAVTLARASRMLGALQASRCGVDGCRRPSASYRERGSLNLCAHHAQRATVLQARGARATTEAGRRAQAEALRQQHAALLRGGRPT